MQLDRQSSLEYAAYISEAALQKGLEERPDAIANDDLFPLVETLCQVYQYLKQDQVHQPDIYQPGGEWNIYVETHHKLYEAWLKTDVPGAADRFRNFWRNEFGPIVKQYATYQKLQESEETRTRFIDWMAYDYMIWLHLFNQHPKELEIPTVGNPWGYVVEDVLIAPKALRYDVLSRQIKDIVQGISQPVIAEIGAGYGGVAHYLMRGEEPFTYINFDLPETLILNSYYLKRTLPHCKILLYDPSVELTASTLEDYDLILMPNWMMSRLPANSVDLFLNTFSLSEMPIATISEYIRHIERCCRGYFLHNNMDRSGVVNAGYERIPCSQYPISPSVFKRLYKRYDLFQRLHSGRDGDYREELYQRISQA